jgi:hypothetical protein
MKLKIANLICLLVTPAFLFAQENTNTNKFRQLGPELRSPNVYRTASGAPGEKYWQQKADYEIEIELDDEKQRIYGEETITYYNNSPHDLTYLWVQLDQNMRAKDSDSYKIRESSIDPNDVSKRELDRLEPWFDGGFKLDYVKDGSGNDLEHTVNKTMMRVDLPQKLRAGQNTVIKIKWWYNINDRMKIGGRSGYEYFEDEDNYLYTIAQFYPRMAVYSDNNGWINKQFLGRGEFTLPFGDFEVSITAPEDHVIAATGTLQNERSVLTSKQRSRMDDAREADEPVMIITEEEARENEKTKAEGKKTWEFHAENVRDFGFASSRKFLWDAQGVNIGGNEILAMSYYPKEGNPLWERFSTKAVVQTLETYSKHTIDYPYPVAISVNAARIGMEYPMICFNYGRPEEDGTYTERLKYGMIGVIIHEVGHNFFPMIINSDERQWTWMDEGLNTFCQFLTEQEWDRNYPSRRGPARNIVDYMKGDPSKISPIMTNSESIYQFGNNAYGKPATALNILRETVMGRELFDFAFKTYAERWAFKHPTPADFFRTMEDASAVDLDWFWRGWFYTTDHVDIGMESVEWYQISTANPEVEKPLAREKEEGEPEDITDIRNEEDIPETRVEKDESIRDFYVKNDPYQVTLLDKQEYQAYLDNLSEEEKEVLQSGDNFYEITFKNNGGLVMPLIVKFEYEDGTSEIVHIPAEIWRMSEPTVTKVFVTDQPATRIVLDPHLETADTEMSDNYWPKQPTPTRFELFKDKMEKQNENPMQRNQRNEDLKD